MTVWQESSRETLALEIDTAAALLCRWCCVRRQAQSASFLGILCFLVHPARVLRWNQPITLAGGVQAHLLNAIGLASAKGICHDRFGFINRIANRREPPKGRD